MTEVLNDSMADDLIAQANTFLEKQRGVQLDGSFASFDMTKRVVPLSEHAESLVTAIPANNNGLYAVLSHKNSNQFEEVASTLASYFVLVPSLLVGDTNPAFYPAIISEEGTTRDQIRLQVFSLPYKQSTRAAASIMLSAAGQSELPGVGEHSRVDNDALEAEHLSTLFVAGADKAVLGKWRNGTHINHAWRKNRASSVLSEVSSRLFDRNMQQQTVTVTRWQIENQKVILFWHEEMRNPDSGKPEAANRHNALLVVQGLGFEAMKERNPGGKDIVKELIS